MVASLITVCAVLPAEFHLDPTGFGTAAGLMSLSAAPEARAPPWAPAAGAAAPQVLARSYPAPFRTDTIDIPWRPAESTGSELEYKVQMSAGQSLVYSWSVAAPPEEFYFDFHSEKRPAAKETVISHEQAVGVARNGSLTAPFDGIHGWYFQNQSVKPVTVHLKLSGFYTLLPGGKPPAP
ncbi:MAG: hypothetical protein WDN45_00810 [Caulobacteraceae bacterium]